jgi:hypothetical protein
MGNMRKKNVLLGKPKGKRLLGRIKLRWEDNITMEFGEIGFAGVNWIHLAQNRDQLRALVNTAVNILVP